MLQETYPSVTFHLPGIFSTLILKDLIRWPMSVCPAPTSLQAPALARPSQPLTPELNFGGCEPHTRASVVTVGPNHLCQVPRPTRCAQGGQPTAPAPQPGPTHAAGRWGSCWPGSAACPHTSYTGTGAGTAGSACPAGLTGTPHTRCCCRCSPRLRAVGTPRGRVSAGSQGPQAGARMGSGAGRCSLPRPPHRLSTTSPGGCCGKREAQEGRGRSRWSRTPPETWPRADPARCAPKDRDENLRPASNTHQTKKPGSHSTPANHRENVEKTQQYGASLAEGTCLLG